MKINLRIFMKTASNVILCVRTYNHTFCVIVILRQMRHCFVCVRVKGKSLPARSGKNVKKIVPLCINSKCTFKVTVTIDVTGPYQLIPVEWSYGGECVQEMNVKERSLFQVRKVMGWL